MIKAAANVWGLPLSPLTRGEAAEAVMGLIEAGIPSYFITANTHYAMLTAERLDLQRINDQAEFIVADGAPLVWASRRGPVRLPERVAGSDLIYDLCEQAATRGKSVYFLGGGEGVAIEASRRLVALYPGLKVVGTSCPSAREMAGDGVAQILDEIKAAHPDLLVVALTMPRGELWLAEHYQALGVPACVNLGATLDFVAGRVRRAPRFLQKVGMEWAYRMYLEPSRLAPRYARNAMFLLSNMARDMIGQGRRDRAMP